MWLHLGYAFHDRRVREILWERGMLIDHTTVFHANRTDSRLTPVDDFRHPPPAPLSTQRPTTPAFGT
jgi:transposase-like protein